VEGIQVCSIEGNIPSPRGDNNESKNTLNLKKKKIFSRTSRSNSIKLKANYPCMKGIKVRSNKGPGTIQRGDNRKNGVGLFKNLIIKNYEARKS
jgi:hypothetical protein